MHQTLNQTDLHTLAFSHYPPILHTLLARNHLKSITSSNLLGACQMSTASNNHRGSQYRMKSRFPEFMDFLTIHEIV